MADVYLVSNLGTNTGSGAFSHLFDTDDNGFISRVELNPNGTVAGVNERWIAHPDMADGDTEATADVDGVTGITIQGRSLYAVDRDEILVFDLDDPSSSMSIALPGAGVAASEDLSLPNDIVVAADGTIWLTDTGLAADASRTSTDAVWKFVDGSMWGKMAGGVETLVTVEGPADGVGRLDGLIRQKNGKLVFSDWRVPQAGLEAGGGVLRWVSPGARTVQRVTVDGLTFPADIAFDAKRQRVLIPSDGDRALKIVRGGS